MVGTTHSSDSSGYYSEGIAIVVVAAVRAPTSALDLSLSLSYTSYAYHCLASDPSATDESAATTCAFCSDPERVL